MNDWFVVEMGSVALDGRVAGKCGLAVTAPDKEGAAAEYWARCNVADPWGSVLVFALDRPYIVGVDEKEAVHGQ